MITVEHLENGQTEVRKGNLVLIQTNLNGFKHNDCSIHHEDYVELVSSWDKRFNELIIALSESKI